ncbi:MAG: hemerythrin domain-containing protein [Hydrogenophaga sp.]|uniref:hemerythrin domain-containing protein n=1 Tax=Hydrogenophaga sp. TaxID=1904254 RepID=UPI00277543FA|nr:hemerythrin domain-containing protein [Hydrogenophaga sp.]MDP2417890.1 hemerythrin domain-containing protein [Hydrogenophaga sp.]MDZ4190245.1 hemerythrin domain-containing protein [Hydrogenophaga sp.]
MAMSIPLSQITLPGHRAPGAGFEAPFEMLDACHERVHRMLALLGKLQQHTQAHGWSEQVAQAAVDVMRYFDLAAPRHHEDEERHVFPPLLAGPDPALRALVLRLRQDHRDMEAAWAQAREVLVFASQPPPANWADFTPAQTALLHHFSSLYQRHIADEDSTVYPAAQAQMGAEAMQAMSADMMRRRGLELR